MTETQLVPVILSGGSGTRLWPVSRPDAPKQLLPMVDERTMLLATLQRVAMLDNRAPAVVVCNEAHRDAVFRDLVDAGEGGAQILMEPAGRNTAPAVAAVACLLENDPLLLVVPADHVILDEHAFADAVARGVSAAMAGNLVTFGIVPSSPATGYGYIHAKGTGADVRTVDAFVEKPDLATAERFLAEGTYLWNSGMFMFRASRFIEEADRYAPEIVGAAQRAVAASQEVTPQTHLLDAEAFGDAPSISIDYAVMEHTDHAVVIPLDAGWSDVGSWDSLHGAIAADANGNVCVGDVTSKNVAHSYLRTDGPLLAAIGVEDLVVVATEDAVLVAHAEHSEDVKVIVEELRAQDRPEVERSAGLLTSWGHRQVLSRTHESQVERLDLRGGRKVPLPPGTWVILAGNGETEQGPVTAGDSGVVQPGDRVELINSGASTLVVMIVTKATG